MRKARYPILLLFVVIIGLLHFFTPGYMLLYHSFYRRLSYFPIVLAGIWFGVSGGFIIALLSSIAFIPHILLYVGQGPDMYLGEIVEVVLYLAAGTVTGFIAGRESKLRIKYEQLAERLENSYKKLHSETELLLEAEKQLAVSQKFSALGQLSASIAHEIKNPLASIRGTAEIFLDEFPKGHPKREFSEILLKEVGRLNATVDEVLQYSRGDQKIAGNSEPVSEVINRVEKLLKTHLRKKRINFTVEGLQEGEIFPVDGDKLSQVFLNIILNSIDALSDNGNIVLCLEPQAEGMSISISDDGPGVPVIDRERIFESFVTEKDGGIGLGLSISKKIVESYGGKISCSASKSGGACFTVALPLLK